MTKDNIKPKNACNPFLDFQTPKLLYSVPRSKIEYLITSPRLGICVPLAVDPILSFIISQVIHTTGTRGFAC